MTKWNRVSGDVGDTLVAYLYNVTGIPTTSESHVGPPGTSTTLTAATVVGVDPSGVACLVHTVQLGAWLQTLTLTADTAVYRLEHQVSFVDARTVTWYGDTLVVARQAA